MIDDIGVNQNRTYIAIDLKSFYASVECVDRGLDPLTTNLVVADVSRTEKTICLAVSPSLKAYGIGGRARLFEVVQKVREVNNERRRAAGWRMTGKSFNDLELQAHPDLELDYIAAPPRMAHYIEVSTKVYQTYLKYIAPEDIHVYSIDEVFMDVTAYLGTYKMTAHELAMKIIRDVLATTGITATAGIGTNMYLAKVAMDIVAKKMPADKDGVRIAELDEMAYRHELWDYRPLTKFWRVGRGIAEKLAVYGIDTMGKLARMSVQNEGLLYRLFGVNAELLIDHAWGWEPTTIEYIKKYRPSTNSLSSGQVLKEPYDYDKARLIVKEMTELLVLDLVRKGLVTKQITLTINYDRESLTVLKRGKTIKDTVYAVNKTGKPYEGKVGTDFYGRPSPRHAHGTGNIERYTNSTKKIMQTMMELFTRITDPDLLVRRVNVCACNLIRERDIPAEGPEQLSLFFDYETVKKERDAEKKDEEKERNIQRTMLNLQGRFGKNAVLKGMNLMEGATTKERNGQVGGHKAE